MSEIGQSSKETGPQPTRQQSTREQPASPAGSLNRTQFVQYIGSLPYEEQVATLKPPMPMMMPSPAVQKTAVQRSEAGSDTLKLRFGGTTICVKKPAEPNTPKTISIEQTVNGVTLHSARIAVNDQGKIKSGSVTASVGLNIVGASCKAKLALKVSKSGRVSGSAHADVQEGAFSGSATLKLGSGGPSGTATGKLTAGTSLAVGAGSFAVEPGASATVKLSAGEMKKLNFKKVAGTYSDATGALVRLSGTGGWAPQKFGAKGTAKLLRTVSLEAGMYTVDLSQGAADGQVEVNQKGLETLSGSLTAKVGHGLFRNLGTGMLTGAYENYGKKISGRAEFSLGQDVAFGEASGFNVTAAKAGAKVALAMAKSGRGTLEIKNLASSVAMGGKQIASGQATDVYYDGEVLKGQFQLTVDQGFELELGPGKVKLADGANLKIGWDGTLPTLEGQGLEASFDWSKLDISLSWPKWRFGKGGFLSPFPKIRLPDIDFSKFLAWLKSLLPDIPEWVWRAWGALEGLFGGIGALWGKIRAFFESLDFSWPNWNLGGFPWPSLEVFGRLWDRFLEFLQGISISIPLPDLSGWFQGGNMNWDWLKKLLTIPSGLGLEADGTLGVELRGKDFPLITATDLSATLTKDGEPIATVVAPEMSYDGETFIAKATLSFADGFGPRFGKYRLTLKDVTSRLTLKRGEDAHFGFEAGVKLSDEAKKKTIATGSVTGVEVTGAGLSFANMSFGFQSCVPIQLENANGFAFSLSEGAEFDLGLRGGDIGTLSATGVDAQIQRSGADFASVTCDHFNYDVDAGVTSAAGAASLDQALELFPGLELGEGSVSVAVENNQITTITVDGLDLRFDRELAGKAMQFDGSIGRGTFDFANQLLTDLDALLTVATPLEFAATTYSTAVTVGSLRLVAADGVLTGVFFDDASVLVEAGPMALRAAASGSITEAGVNLSATLALEEDVVFGTAEKGLTIGAGTSLGVELVDGQLASIDVDISCSFVWGPAKGTGSITARYAGDSLDGCLTLTLDDAVSLEKGPFSATLAEGAAVSVEVAKSQVASVAIDQAKFSVGALGVDFDGELTNASWGDEGVSGTLALGLSPESAGMVLTIGPKLSLMPESAAVEVQMTNSAIDAITIADVTGSGTYLHERLGPVTVGLQVTDGHWSPSGLSGTATLSLRTPLRFGSEAGGFLFESGSLTAEMTDGVLSSVSVSGLSGGYVVGEERLASITVSQGTFNCLTDELESLLASFTMEPSKEEEVTKGVRFGAVEGEVTHGPEGTRITGSGSVAAEFGSRELAGFAALNWTRDAAGKSSFAGSEMSITGDVIEPLNGRSLVGTVTGLVDEDNIPHLDASLDFTLNEYIGGSVQVRSEPGEHALDWVISGEVGATRALIEERTLVDMHFGQLDERAQNLKEVSEESPLKVGGGLSLSTGALTGEGKFEIDEWRPALESGPQFDGEIDLAWPIQLDADLLAELGFGFPPIAGLFGVDLALKGGVGATATAPVGVKLGLEREGEDYTPKAKFNVGLIAGGVATFSVMVDLSVISLRTRFNAGQFDFDLGELFSLNLDSGDGAPKQTAATTGGSQRAPREHADQALDTGQGPMGSMSQSKGGQGPAAMTELLGKMELVKKAGFGVKGLMTLVKLIVDGIKAFRNGGPVWFALWCVKELVTGVIGRVETAIDQIGEGITAMNELFGEDLRSSEDTRWLGEAIATADRRADDRARELVNAGEHRKMSMADQALLVRAMYPGSCGDEDEGCILRVFTDSSDLGALLALISGNVREGVKRALSELDGSEDAHLRALLRTRGLVDELVGDDVAYVAKVHADGSWRSMGPLGRGLLFKYIQDAATGGSGLVDLGLEVPGWRKKLAGDIMRFSIEKGDLGGALSQAFGKVGYGFQALRVILSPADMAVFREWFRTTTPSERWKDQIAALQSQFAEGAGEALDAERKLRRRERTWSDALRFLARQEPFVRPFTGPAAGACWSAVVGGVPELKEQSEADRAAFKEAVDSGSLKGLRIDIGKAVLTGRAAKIKRKVREWWRARKAE